VISWFQSLLSNSTLPLQRGLEGERSGSGSRAGGSLPPSPSKTARTSLHALEVLSGEISSSGDINVNHSHPAGGLGRGSGSAAASGSGATEVVGLSRRESLSGPGPSTGGLSTLSRLASSGDISGGAVQVESS
jgi:hypothetical protein